MNTNSLSSECCRLMIATDTGTEAAQKAGQLAAKKEIEWALAGWRCIFMVVSD